MNQRSFLLFILLLSPCFTTFMKNEMADQLCSIQDEDGDEVRFPEGQSRIVDLIQQVKYQPERIPELIDYIEGDITRNAGYCFDSRYMNNSHLRNAIYWQSWPAVETLLDLHQEKRAAINIWELDPDHNSIVHLLCSNKAPLYIFQKTVSMLPPSLVNLRNLHLNETPLETHLRYSDNITISKILITAGSPCDESTIQQAERFHRTHSKVYLKSFLEQQKEKFKSKKGKCRRLPPTPDPENQTYYFDN